MKTRLIFATLRFGILPGGFCLLTSLVQAQALPGAVSQVAAAAHQQAFVDGKALFAAKDFAYGEAVLEAGNRQKPGTPQWNVESGFSLMRVAFEFRAQGNPAVAAVAVQRALTQLNEATAKFALARSPLEEANLHEIRGQIYERLLGDRAAAAEDYAAAVSLAPNFGQAAALLARLRAEDAELAKKRLGQPRG